jgi:valyl-tRNA synthetase
LIASVDASQKTIPVLLPGVQAYLPLGSLVDLAQERERLEKEKARLESELKRSEGLLQNPQFIQKAPAEKLAAERAKHQNYADLLKQTEQRIEALKD